MLVKKIKLKKTKLFQSLDRDNNSFFYNYEYLCKDMICEILGFLSTLNLIKIRLVCTLWDDYILEIILRRISVKEMYTSLSTSILRHNPFFTQKIIERILDNKTFKSLYVPNIKDLSENKIVLKKLIFELIKKEELCEKCIGNFNITTQKRKLVLDYKFNCHLCDDYNMSFCCNEKRNEHVKKYLEPNGVCSKHKKWVCGKCAKKLKVCNICKQICCRTDICYMCNKIYCSKCTFKCVYCKQYIGYCDKCIYNYYTQDCFKCSNKWFDYETLSVMKNLNKKAYGLYTYRI